MNLLRPYAPILPVQDQEGFVQFFSEAEVRTVIESFNQKTVAGCNALTAKFYIKFQTLFLI